VREISDFWKGERREETERQKKKERKNFKKRNETDNDCDKNDNKGRNLHKDGVLVGRFFKAREKKRLDSSTSKKKGQQR
jgi:hypothetical protein